MNKKPAPELAIDMNQQDNGGFWFKDITIRKKEIALEYVMTGDKESLMRFVLKQCNALEAEYAGIKAYRNAHPLFDIIPDLEMVLQVKLRFAARLVARQVHKGEDIQLDKLSPEAFADYFNDNE